MPIMRGQRGVVIINFLTIIVGYMLFRRYLNARINKAVNVIGIFAVIMLSLPIAAITLSRYQKEKTAVSDYINWYIGQGNLYFNNHGLDAGGIRYGDRTLNLFKRLIDHDTPKNFVERREKYHNLDLDDNLFSTFVGDFTIDFGPYLATVIFVIFNLWVLSQIRVRGGTIKLHQLLLLFFTICVCMQGGMTLFSFSDTGNLRIIAFALLYIYLRYHDTLMQKYPLITRHY
jgi:oligosaccharide repeat unit polymerase